MIQRQVVPHFLCFWSDVRWTNVNMTAQQAVVLNDWHTGTAHLHSHPLKCKTSGRESICRPTLH